MCRAIPFPVRDLTKQQHFFVLYIVVKTNRNVVYRGLFSYR